MTNTRYRKFRLWFRSLRATHAIMLGYACYVFVIFLLLCLPFCHKAEYIPLIDHFFIATSAISTTGLSTVNVPEVYNFWGDLFILIGIQIGGLGYMTLGSFAILASKGRISKHRLSIGKSVYAMPDQFEPAKFLKHVVFFTIAIESVGAILLWFAFTEAKVENPLWAAIFHSVSSFCTAGFSTYSGGMEGFRNNTMVNLVVSALSIGGAIGFIVFEDIYRSFRSKIIYVTLTTKIILVSTFGTLVFGTVLLFFDETISQLPLNERILASFFQTMSALTTVGFASVPLGKLSSSCCVVVIVLMLLGASPSGTGGGLKCTTWSAGLATIWSYLRGREEITFWGSQIPRNRINAAFASFVLYLAMFSLGTYLLLLCDKHGFEDITFEVASALGTVGLSRGITPELTTSGKLTICLLMYIGRLGVLSLALGAVKMSSAPIDSKEESMKIKDDIIL